MITTPASSDLDPAARDFPEFSLARLLATVFKPLDGCRICVLTDLRDPASEAPGFRFLAMPGYEVQRRAVERFLNPLRESVMQELDLHGGDFFAYSITQGSNLDLPDDAWNEHGSKVSLSRDVFPNYDIILCISTFSATAPLTAHCKAFGFRGATLHGVNDVILRTGLAVDYEAVSADAERIRLALTGADEIEIDFELEDGRVLTAWLGLNGQEAQKSHGLCQGKDRPDVANLPAGEVYFVPVDARGQFPLKYEDGTLAVLDVEHRQIRRASLIAGNQATVDDHNAKLADDPMTGTLGELGFGTQILPVSGADIQDEKILGTCHLATGRDDHLGGDIVPSMFKRHENSTHDDILFAPHKTPNFNLRQVRMRRGSQHEILIEEFRPAPYLVRALSGS